MVRRALDREVERDLDAVLAPGRHEPVEVRQRAELGMDRVVAAVEPIAPPIAHGLPGSPFSAASALLRPFRFVVPIGWIGGR